MSRAEKVVSMVKAIHRKLRLSAEVSLNTLIDLCSVYALEIIEAGLLDGREIEAVIRTPLFMSDHEHNARLSVTLLTQIVPGLDLNHIDPIKVITTDGCVNKVCREGFLVTSL
jgi:hypothetical protein